jgi:hypothetical protein
MPKGKGRDKKSKRPSEIGAPPEPSEEVIGPLLAAFVARRNERLFGTTPRVKRGTAKRSKRSTK